MKPLIFSLLLSLLAGPICTAQGVTTYHPSNPPDRHSWYYKQGPKHESWVHWLWPFDRRLTYLKGSQMRYFIRRAKKNNNKEGNGVIQIDPPCLNGILSPTGRYQDPPRVPRYGCLNYHNQPTPDTIEQQVVKDPLQTLLSMAPSCLVASAPQIIPHNVDNDAKPSRPAVKYSTIFINWIQVYRMVW